ncbi:hypothetical protein E2562_009872 [Oryza meyeriana var. granulata]|uniref:Uncharacterized protein n=1 Tax=Oryza meyeriana var. granulata TaxID=110450 RepID=A0A6G1BUL5_9ORYZ|nr:hypothetical protein E2562_009872 [Oryza meyeriana var. granulata]
MEPAAAAAPGKASHHTVTAFHAAAATTPGETTPSATRASRWSSLAATAASLVAVGLGGAALLVWWALAFHPANARLWMVPAGLVLLGTPILAWLSLCASAGPCAAVRDAPARV